MTQILVIAKEPVPGRVKTRLCPPCTAEQAAGWPPPRWPTPCARCAATPAVRRVLAPQGRPGAWLPDGFTRDPAARRLDWTSGSRPRSPGRHRLTGAHVLIGMDTPQVTAGLLPSAAAGAGLHDGRRRVRSGRPTAASGLLGLRRPDGRAAAAACRCHRPTPEPSSSAPARRPD